MQTVAELPEYLKKAKRLLPEKEREYIVYYLAEHPKAGVLMQGTGGRRKLRWARQGTGKSGGVRIIYYYHDDRMPLYLLTLFGKGEKDNLSRAERNQLAKLVRHLIDYWRKRHE